MLKVVIATLALSLASLSASGQMMDFEDISIPKETNYQVIKTYHDFTWSNAALINYEYYGRNQSGYKNGTVSGNNTLLNLGGRDMNVSRTNGGSFDLVSAYISSAWHNDMGIRVTGWLNGQEVNSMTLTVNATGPTEVLFNFTGIDKVTFTSLQQTGSHAGFKNSGWQMAIDNLVMNLVTAVPEPSTYAMMFAGLGIIGLMVRRRKITI